MALLGGRADGRVWLCAECAERMEDHALAPDELRALEPGLRELITGKLNRGKIECLVLFAHQGGELLMDDPDQCLARRQTADHFLADRLLSHPGDEVGNVSSVLAVPGIRNSEAKVGVLDVSLDTT